eukprot:tig00021073_g18060.t1
MQDQDRELEAYRDNRAVCFVVEGRNTYHFACCPAMYEGGAEHTNYSRVNPRLKGYVFRNEAQMRAWAKAQVMDKCRVYTFRCTKY